MAYSATKARIAGKIASGGFNQPDNTLAKAIDTGAGIMAKSIIRQGEEEREEKRIAKREAAAEAKRLAAAQRAKEAEAKKIAKNAKVLALDFTGTADNVAAVTYFQNQLELMDGDVGAVVTSTENRVKSGQLEFIAPSTEMVDMPFQGPNIPANAKLEDFGGRVGSNKYKDGKDITLGDLPKISTNEKNSPSLRSQASEMNDMFGHLAEGTTLPEDGSVEVNTPGGVKIKPFVKQSDIDWMSVSQTDVENLRRLHDSGQQVLDDQDLKVLALYESDFAEVEAANVTAANVEISRKILLMGVDDLQGVLEATDDVYDPDMKSLAQNLLNKKQGVIQETAKADAAAKALEFRRSLATMDADDLRGIQASGSHTPEEKAEATAQLAARPGEPFNITDYDDIKDATLKTIIDDPATDPKKVTALQALLSNRNNTAPKVDTKSQDYLITYLDESGEKQSTVAKMAADGSGFVDLTSLKPVVPAEGTQPLNMELQSDLYDNIVKINTSLIKPLKEQRVAMVTTLASAKKLDDIAKRSPEILTVVGGKVPAVLKRVGLETKALVDLFNSNGSIEGTLSTLDQRFNEYINDSSLSGTARDAALFQAEKIKMAFMFAASSLGQSGKGLSNEDFQRALDILDQGSDYTTFSMNMRSQMQSVILMTETQITDFNEDGSAIALNRLDTSGELLAGYQQNAETYATNRGLGDAFAWAKSEVDTAPPTTNPPTLEEFIEKARELNVGTSDADLEAFWTRKYGGSN